MLGIGEPAPTYAPPTATPDVTSTPTPTQRPATSTPTRVTSTPTSTFLPAVPAGADALPTETPVRSSSSTSTRTPTRNTRTPLPSQQATSVSLPATATPTITPTSDQRTQFRVEQIELPTYPYTAFLSAATDPGRNHYALRVLDRGAYEASDPQPASVTYDLLVLENDYLRVSILPALGGRIYECVFKPTGNNEFYQNPVIKPTNWGPPGSDYPAGANWWLAAGGLEWGFPVEEHGYEWGSAWSYATATPARWGRGGDALDRQRRGIPRIGDDCAGAR